MWQACTIRAAGVFDGWRKDRTIDANQTGASAISDANVKISRTRTH
jgi:hypothetical protein